ncbi:MAG: xanthine dehydrogenase family protein subunit M [Deltaproteobacteria bacterium]|nr:xanthine dehydrogenase family protein subunit M [Deltaproteobacteria bacterium]
MNLPKFDYEAPSDLQEACEIKACYGDRAALLAGGTDLLITLQKGWLAPSRVVSLERLEELKEMAGFSAGLTIGARITAAELAESWLGTAEQVLSEAAAQVGSPLIRNRATIGGNLVSAMPAADLAPPLLALQAAVVLNRVGSERVVDLEDFFVAPGEQVMQPDEIMSEIFIPNLPEGSGGAFEKLGVRKALERSIVSVAAVVSLDGDGKTIAGARIALGAVAPTPMLAGEAADSLIGKKATAKNFAAAAKIAAGEARPRGLRTSAEYSRLMVETLTKRALQRAFAAATA